VYLLSRARVSPKGAKALTLEGEEGAELLPPDKSPILLSMARRDREPIDAFAEYSRILSSDDKGARPAQLGGNEKSLFGVHGERTHARGERRTGCADVFWPARKIDKNAQINAARGSGTTGWHLAFLYKSPPWS